MTHIRSFGAALVIAALSAAPAQSQASIASRVARAPDGLVRLQFTGHPGVCGNGRDLIGYKTVIFSGSVQSFGKWSAPACAPGPVRVSLGVSRGRVTQMQTFVGGGWAPTSSRITDLGTVSSSEAASYFFGLVPELEGRTNKARLLLPAVLAADDATAARLVSLSRDASRAQSTRKEAIQWIGLLGDASVIPTLVAFARQGGDAGRGEDIDDNGDTHGRKGLATAALASLSFLENGIGIPSLIGLARSGGSAVRHSAVFWLGQSGDRRALSALHAIIETASEDERIRAHGIFSLAHGGDNPDSEFAWLRGLYPRLQSERLKESVIQGMGQDEAAGSAWLLERARDRGETMKLRKAALFWAGQKESTPTASIVAFYGTVSEHDLREHTIFVLSQRQDDAAITELLRIARSDNDRNMRSKALFWLGQKDDPRVANFITERLER